MDTRNPSRNLNIMALCQRGLTLFQENFSLFMTVSLCYGLADLLDDLILKLVPPNLSWTAFLLNLLIRSWPSLIIIQLASCLHLDRRISFRKILKDSRRLYWRFVFVTLASTLIVLAGMMAFILPGLYFGTVFIFVEILVVLEKKDFPAVFHRSRELAQPFFWNILGLSLLLGILALSQYMLFQGVSRWNPGLAKGLVVIASMLLLPYIQIVQVCLYHEVKASPQESFEDAGFEDAECDDRTGMSQDDLQEPSDEDEKRAEE